MKSVRLALALCVAVAATLHAGAKKPAPVSIRFYGEAGAEGGNFSDKVTLIQNGRETYMGSMPLITEREILTFSSFPAKDGTFGAYFWLDDHGTRLLEQHTMSRRGTYVIVFFNGTHLLDEYVDKPVHDGIATIPSGLTQKDIDLLDMTFPRFGHDGEKPALKRVAQ
ncbi:MAG: hypothetical protein ACREKL_17165 [Chthoniobacterales bacterium]